MTQGDSKHEEEFWSYVSFPFNEAQLFLTHEELRHRYGIVGVGRVWGQKTWEGS